MPEPSTPPVQTLLSPAFTRVSWTRRVLRQPRGRLIAEIVATIFLIGGIFLWSGAGRRWRGESPLLATPVLALEALQSKSLYFNGVAWPWLKKQRPDLLPPDASTDSSDLVRSFTQAVQNPKLFRQLDRQYRFDALLLTGDPTQFRSLLEHLLETRDWTVAYVDHTSIVFKRGAERPWKSSDLASIKERFAQAPKRDRAIFLAKTAGKLIAIREPAEARVLLEEAQALRTESADVESTWAQYSLSRGEWKDALAAAERALKIDGGNLSALGTKAQALYSTKRFGEAFVISKQLVLKMPDEPALLFYHARIAHEARAFQEEARALRRLIALAEANSRPTSGYRVYLGQCLATAGEAKPAMEEFETALADQDLPKEQRAFAKECMALVRQQAGR